MEASENAGHTREGRSATGLQRIDIDHMREKLRKRTALAGYERLGLMVDTIIPRLTGEPARRRD